MHIEFIEAIGTTCDYLGDIEDIRKKCIKFK